MKLDWQLDNQNKFYFNVFHSFNRFQIPNYPSSFQRGDEYFKRGYRDTFGNQSDHDHRPTYVWVPSHTNDIQLERNAYLQTIWKHTFSENSFLQFAPYYKYTRIQFQNDPLNDLASKDLPNDNEDAATLFQDRTVHHGGLKTDYTYRLHPQHLLKTGFQVQVSRSQGVLTIQTDKVDPNAVFTNRDPVTGYFEGIYIQDDFKISPQWILNVGLRYDATQFVFSDVHSEDSLLQPRMGLNYLPSERTKLHAFYGKLFNPAPLENLRKAFHYIHGGPKIENYDIKAQKDNYYEVGVDYLVFPRQVLTFNLYYRDSIHVIDEAQLLRTAIAQPFNLAEGYSYGAEVSLKGNITEEWSQYVNYSYAMGKGKGISGGIWASHDHGSSNAYQVYDHLQFHTANAGVTYSKNGFWWAGQGVFGSGLRTGPNNSINLPHHFTLDTTVGYELKKKDSWLTGVKIAGDILNILDNRYPLTLANEFNGSRYVVGRQFVIHLAKDF